MRMMGPSTGRARTRLGLAVVVAAVGCLAGAQGALALPADTTITAGPADLALTNDNTPTFEFNASDGGLNFACSIDGPAATFACSSPYTTPPLADGGHVVRVAAVNAGSETDATPASRSFTVDATPPETTITSGPAEGEVVNTDAPAFTWASNEPGATFSCIADAIPLMSCELAFATGAAAGSHSFSIAARDPAGNTDPTPATRTFTISLTGAPPTLPHCLYDGDAIVGTSGNDTRVGTAGTDLMFGLGGADVLRGAGGPDCIAGGAGNDRLFGEAGMDYLSGGSGNDNLVGGPGNDELRAGPGNDRVTGSEGLDILVGDAGNDRLTDVRGRDTFHGGAGNDRITSRDNTAFGRRASDIVSCGAGRDVAIVDRGDRVSRDCERVVKG
jgi:Ca2+-binding RTX toxin-like protein